MSKRLAEDLQAGVAQCGAGGDDVGDRIGDAEPHRGLHRAVEADHLRGDAVLDEIGLDDAGVGGGDALADEVGGPLDGAGARGEAKRGEAEAERDDRFGRRAGVEQQVLAGDADVELAGADVDRDVARAEEEELGLVLGVEQDELAAVAALPVAGLDEHLAGRFGERALVRNGDAEHGSTCLWVRTGRRASTDVGRRRRARCPCPA